MDQIIVTHPDNTTILLRSHAAVSGITNATQSVDLLGADTVDITVESSTPITFQVGDKITIFGNVYTLNLPPRERKISSNRYTYTVQFEGIQYDLIRPLYNVNIDTTNNQIQDVSGDALTGDMEMFLNVLIANVNRVFPDKWLLGSFPTDTETKTLTFSESENCLQVLQSLCSEENYGTEFQIVQNGDGTVTLNIGTFGTTHTITYQYGKGKGLYELTRDKVSNSSMITRLYVYGGSKNVTSVYRCSKLCLPGKSKAQSFIDDSGVISSSGLWENTKSFDNIYPHRTGTISALGANVYAFIDSSMDFDLNEAWDDTDLDYAAYLLINPDLTRQQYIDQVVGNTKYALAGVPAKIHFNTGNLAGYEFEISTYDPDTKGFVLVKLSDDRNMTFPSETSSAFQFSVGDEYVILDITMPDSYVSAAEAELLAAGTEFYNQNYVPKVQYSLAIDPLFLQDRYGSTPSNIYWVGDYIPIIDTDLGVDKTLRVKGFKRDLLNEFSYSLTISDQPVIVTTINRVISDLAEIDKIIKINNLRDPARARRNFLAAQEIMNMIFDADGYYFTDKIKPLSIETTFLSVGARSQQFGLEDTIFQPNFGGNRNRIVYNAGTLIHYTIVDSDNNPKIWTLSSGDVVLPTDEAYYIYAEIEKTSAGGILVFTKDQLSVDGNGVYYYILVGIVNSVDAVKHTRCISLMGGFTTINGRYITTGRIQSGDGATYFDLDSGEISGKITFSSGSSGYANIDDAPDVNALIESIQSQIDGQIMTWFYDYAPTLANMPASDWTTDTDKDKHLGDLFYDNSTGYAYRFTKIGTVYSWVQVQDTDITTALAMAAAAQDTADGKRRVFVATPTTPYDVGDLWSQGPSGELMRCSIARATGSYNASDWVKASSYDNTKTVIDGGVVTSGTIQLAGSDANIKAGITGNGTTDTDVRIWAGATYANRNAAPFRVNQGGNVFATSGTIGGWHIDVEALYSGTMHTSDGFSTSGITLAAEGSIHAPNLYVNLDGEVGIRGKQIILAYSGVSETVIISNDAEVIRISTTYLLAKTITLGANVKPGRTLRIKFTLASDSSTYAAYGRIYRNGVAVGTERTAGTTPTTYSQDISGWQPSDTIQIYLRGGAVGVQASVTNFRVCGTLAAIVNEITGTIS